MNIIEAVRTGKPFKRTGWPATEYQTINWHSGFSAEDVLAEDWEVESPLVTITQEQFTAAWVEAVTIGLPNNVRARNIIAKRLGLK